MIKERIINQIMIAEGGYAENSDDSGGRTMYGITEAVARKNGWAGKMDQLPRQFAFKLYEDKYWNAVKANELVELSQNIAAEVVDSGVNLGVQRTSIILQRSLNLLNNKQRYYKDIKIDGVIGNKTIAALRSYLVYRDEIVFVKLLNIYQGAFYIRLTERREKDETFIYGWIKQRVVL